MGSWPDWPVSAAWGQLPRTTMLVMLLALRADLILESTKASKNKADKTIKPEPKAPPATSSFLLEGSGFLGKIGSSIKVWEEVVMRSYCLSRAWFSPCSKLRYW